MQQAQAIVKRVPVAEHVYEHAVQLSRSTRTKVGQMPESLQGMVHWGAGPRNDGRAVRIVFGNAGCEGNRRQQSDRQKTAIRHPVNRDRIGINGAGHRR